MNTSTRFNLIKTSALIIAVIFTADMVFHFLIPGTLDITAFSLQGDIDFMNVGVINVFLRYFFLISAAMFPEKIRKFMIIPLLGAMIPFVYLMITSWAFFAYYIGMYFYWALLLGFTILVGIQAYKPLLSKKAFFIVISTLSVASALTIFIEYVIIMGFNWPYEFVYSLFQHIFYDVAMLFIGGLLAIKD